MGEEEEKLRKIFKHFDKDKSGYLDTHELNGILDRVNIKLDKDNMVMLLQRYDEDNNGRLGEDEFWY